MVEKKLNSLCLTANSLSLSNFEIQLTLFLSQIVLISALLRPKSILMVFVIQALFTKVGFDCSCEIATSLFSIF